MPGPGDSHRGTGDAAPRLTVVVPGGALTDVQATVAALLDTTGTALEIVVVRRWRTDAWPDDALPGGVSVVDHVTANPVGAANSGIAAARGERILFVGAGDRPASAELLAAHVDADAEIVAGAVRARGADPVRDGWVGLRPDGVPGFASRHLSATRAALADGFDDRCRDLDVAAIELLARHAAVVSWRAELLLEEGQPGDSAARAEAAGRAAHVLDEVASFTSHARGPARARVLLRWARPGLEALARLPLPGDDQQRREALALRSRFARGRGLPRLPVSEHDRAGVPRQPGDRPPVTVIAPFAGPLDEAMALRDALAGLRLRDGDRVIVADNSVHPTFPASDEIEVVRAVRERTSYSARNDAAARAETEWMLFLDADCVPPPWLLDAYWAPAPGERTGAVVGDILNPPPEGWADRYSADADVLSQARSLAHPFRPYGVTANLLVRRAAWQELGGFSEGARSGGDADFCWRLQEHGWGLEHRPHAALLHFHRTSLKGLVRQYRRYGAGVAWLERRHPGATHGWPALPPHAARAVLTDVVAGRGTSAATRAIDLVCVLAAMRGAREPNAPSPWPEREHGAPTSAEPAARSPQARL